MSESRIDAREQPSKIAKIVLIAVRERNDSRPTSRSTRNRFTPVTGTRRLIAESRTTVYTYRDITALITGASKGLGAAYATELARRSANLILVARSATALDGLAERLRDEHGVRVQTVAADLTSADGTARLLGAIDRMQIDLLLNNVGSGAVGPFFHRPRRSPRNCGAQEYASWAPIPARPTQGSSMERMPSWIQRAPTRPRVLRREPWTISPEAGSLLIQVDHRPGSRPGLHECCLASHSPGSSET